MVLCQQIVENQGFRDDETTDDVLLRARMVFLGCVQALGTIFGLGKSFGEDPYSARVLLEQHAAQPFTKPHIYMFKMKRCRLLH